jgi:hypothetical protein
MDKDVEATILFMFDKLLETLRKFPQRKNECIIAICKYIANIKDSTTLENVMNFILKTDIGTDLDNTLLLLSYMDSLYYTLIIIDSMTTKLGHDYTMRILVHFINHTNNDEDEKNDNWQGLMKQKRDHIMKKIKQLREIIKEKEKEKENENKIKSKSIEFIFTPIRHEFDTIYKILINSPIDDMLYKVEAFLEKGANIAHCTLEQLIFYLIECRIPSIIEENYIKRCDSNNNNDIIQQVKHQYRVEEFLHALELVTMPNKEDICNIQKMDDDIVRNFLKECKLV